MDKEQVKRLKIVGLIIAMLAVGIPAVMAVGSLVERVDNLDNERILITKSINNHDVRIVELEKIAAGTEVSLVTISSDVGEIKTDLKEISKDLRQIYILS
jgi:hypothetical protein